MHMKLIERNFVKKEVWVSISASDIVETWFVFFCYFNFDCDPIIWMLIVKLKLTFFTEQTLYKTKLYAIIRVYVYFYKIWTDPEPIWSSLSKVHGHLTCYNSQNITYTKDTSGTWFTAHEFMSVSWLASLVRILSLPSCFVSCLIQLLLLFILLEVWIRAKRFKALINVKVF